MHAFDLKESTLIWVTLSPAFLDMDWWWGISGYCKLMYAIHLLVMYLCHYMICKELVIRYIDQLSRDWSAKLISWENLVILEIYNSPKLKLQSKKLVINSILKAFGNWNTKTCFSKWQNFHFCLFWEANIWVWVNFRLSDLPKFDISE